MRAADSRIGELAIPNVVPWLTETPGQVKWLGPPLGAHNKDIYQGELRPSDADMDQLRNAGVI